MSMPPITHLLYLHGFRSSPQSTKARQMASLVQTRFPNLVWWCPQLPPSPKEAMAMVRAGVADWPKVSMGVVGSSLGGFYASWVAEQTGCRAVLLNPAVQAARDLSKYVGEHTAWHDPNSKFEFKADYVAGLAAWTCSGLQNPGNYFAVIAKGDEVLDWQEMVGRYPSAHTKLLEQSDHALSDFDDHVDEVLEFLGLSMEVKKYL